MKNGLSLLAVLFLIVCASSCDVERSEKYQTLLAERDSLYTEAVAAKGGFDQALSTINEIENALESIRAAEGIIMMENQEGNTSKAVSEINAIQQTLRENRKKQLDDKDVFINNLKDELQQSRQQIADLSEQVSDLSENINDLNSSLDVMNAKNAVQQETIENQDAMLNTVWVCIANEAALVEKGIISKGGLFQAKEISKQGFDNSQFMQADKRDLYIIPLNTKKAKVMTNHPESSYELNEGEQGSLELKIIDKEAFWSISNYLVVSIK